MDKGGEEGREGEHREDSGQTPKLEDGNEAVEELNSILYVRGCGLHSYRKPLDQGPCGGLHSQEVRAQVRTATL